MGEMPQPGVLLKEVNTDLRQNSYAWQEGGAVSSPAGSSFLVRLGFFEPMGGMAGFDSSAPSAGWPSLGESPLAA